MLLLTARTTRSGAYLDHFSSNVRTSSEMLQAGTPVFRAVHAGPPDVATRSRSRRGQVADVAAEGRRGTREEVDWIHMRKTAALIRAAARVGAIAAGAGVDEIELAGRFGEKLGLLFQVTDDILDQTADTDRGVEQKPAKLHLRLLPLTLQQAADKPLGKTKIVKEILNPRSK